ncbi:MAG: FIST signal transduction protein [Candidatus Nanohaloarchaea archaeon]
MDFTVASSSTENSEKAGKQVVQDFNSGKTDLIYLFASTEHELEELVEAASGEVDVPVIGCSSTVEVAGGAETGSAVAAGFSDVEVGIGMREGLDDHSYNAGKEAAREAIEDIDTDFTSYTINEEGEKERDTFVNIFADPLHGNGVHVLDAIEEELGRGYSFAGQFAGDDLSFENAYVFHDGEVVENAVVCCIVKTEGQIGSDKAHGFEETPNSFNVSEAHGSYVKALDGERPKNVYSNLFGEENAEDPGFLLMTPFGLDLGEEEHELRVTLDVDDKGCFVCGAEVPEGEEVSLMRGEKPKLLDAAGRAAREALDDSGLQEDNLEGALVFSCAGRHAIYDDMEKTREEVERIQEELGDTPVFGLFAFGQIATSNGRPAFHEETASIQVFGEK